MFGIPQRSIYAITSSSPTTLDSSCGITPRTIILVDSFDGQGQDYVLSSSCAKISIYQSSNFTLRLSSLPLSSTLEIHSSSHVKIFIDPLPPPPNGIGESQTPLGVVQLDPTLREITLSYASKKLVGRIVLAPRRMKKPISSPIVGQGGALRETSEEERYSFGFESIRLDVPEASFEFVDSEGKLKEPGTGRIVDPQRGEEVAAQWVAKWSKSEQDGTEAWSAEPLQRGEKQYPVL